MNKGKEARLKALVRSWRRRAGKALKASKGSWSGSHWITESLAYAECADALAKALKEGAK